MSLKKVGMIALVFALVFVVAFAASPSVAQAQCAKTSSVNMANLESSVASIVITAYNPDGTEAGVPFDDTIPGDSGAVYFPIPNIPAGFSGSLVVSSDRDVAAIANIVCSDFSAGGSYNAGTGGSTSVKLPLLFKDNSGFDTQFSVQNAGASDANVTVNYSDGTSAPVATIPPGAAKVYDQRTETHPDAIFAAEVTSDGEPILAAALQESSDIIFAYTGAATAGVTDPVFPLVNANNANYITGVQVQNAGTSDTDVTLSYTPSAAGTACTETQTVPAGDSTTFALAVFSGNPAGITTTCINGERFIGSAQVTANSTSQLLVGLVNQLLPGTNGEAYGSFSSDDATNTVVMPLIMDRNSGYFTGINVMNVGSSDATVDCSFTDTDYAISESLAPGEALTAIQQGQIADGYIGAGTCTTTGNSAGKIVATVNQLNGAAAGDQLLVYEGINR